MRRKPSSRFLHVSEPARNAHPDDDFNFFAQSVHIAAKKLAGANPTRLQSVQAV
jgi:hypothetical protein